MKTADESIDQLFETLYKHAEDVVFELCYDSVADSWYVRIDESVRNDSDSLDLKGMSGHGDSLGEAVDHFCATVSNKESKSNV